MATNRQIPNIFHASTLWTAMGPFGLVLGLILLLFDGTVFAVSDWFVDLSHSGPDTLSQEIAALVRDEIDTWAWAGFAVAAIGLTLGNGRVRTRLASLLWPIVGDSLPPDRHGPIFLQPCSPCWSLPD